MFSASIIMLLNIIEPDDALLIAFKQTLYIIFSLLGDVLITFIACAKFSGEQIKKISVEFSSKVSTDFGFNNSKSEPPKSSFL